MYLNTSVLNVLSHSPFVHFPTGRQLPPLSSVLYRIISKRRYILEYSTRVVQEGGRGCKKSILNDLVHLTPLRIPLMNPPYLREVRCTIMDEGTKAEFKRPLLREVQKSGLSQVY